MKQLCVIVINYFAADMTRNCLESLRDEAIDTVHVIDNSADDEAVQQFRKMIEEFEGTGAPTAWTIDVAVNEENLGFGRAINRALLSDLNRGDQHRRYLLMNNDAVGEQGFVAGLTAAADKSERIGLVTPRILWGDEWVCLKWYHRATGHISMSRLPGSFSYATGCCLLVDSRLINDEGNLFDEAFFMYGEDVLLTWRARELGYQVVCADQVSVKHEGSASSSLGSSFYEYHVAKGHLLLAARLTKSQLWNNLATAGRLAYLPARAITRMLRFKTLAPVKALVTAWGTYKSST